MKRTGLRAHVKYFALLSLCVIAIVAVLSSAAMGGGGGAIKTLIAGAAQRCVAMYLQYFAIAGLAFWLCYRYRSVQWAHRKIQQLPPAEGQLRQEITSSALAIASLGVLGVLTLYFYRAGFFKIYSDVGAYGYPYAIASVVLAFVFSDVTFYLFHRLSHRPFLFNLYHELHHRSRRPTPWTTFQLSPIEVLVTTLMLWAYLALVPMHTVALAVFSTLGAIRQIIGHCGYEVFPARMLEHRSFRWFNTNTHHDMHHQFIRCNYGLYFNVLDTLFDTNHHKYKATFERIAGAAAPGSNVTAEGSKQ